ncbi:MAG: hypothetical protein R3F56_06885 [Planctomycetota bacterium]
MSTLDKPLVRVLLLLGLALCVVAVRLGPRHDVVLPDRVLLSDLDTQRRLARLEALDAAASYPIVEVRDGWPDGTTLHWTLPMDWVIRTLDPLVGWLIPGERGYEGGAVLAGPLLAALATCLYAWLAMPLLGVGAALVAALLYGWWYTFVNTSLLGNGDHQTLQQVAAAVALLGILRALAGGFHAGRWAAGSGAAVGVAVWVSTEMMLLDYAFVAALTLAAVWPWRDAAVAMRCRGVLLPFSMSALAMMLCGHLVEHRGDVAALHWDVVSWFQVWQAAVFALFATLLRVRWFGTRGPGSVVAAGVAAVVSGCLPLAFATAREAVAAQLRGAGAVNHWLHAEVAEFRSLAFDGADGGGAWAGLVTIVETLLQRDGWLILAWLAALVALAWSACRPRPLPATDGASALSGVRPDFGAAGSLVLVVLSIITFALYVWEVKLGHLLALTGPLVLVAGWRIGWSALAGTPRLWCDVVAAAVAVVAVFVQLPERRAQMLRQNDAIVHEICQVLRTQGGEGDFGVLAPWSMGAPLLYDAGLGAVATGYHRNFAGIADGFRFWLTDVDQRTAAMDILRRRRVRYVVAWFDRLFLKSGAETIGLSPLRTDREILPAATRTMFWQLRYGKVAGFRLVHDGPQIQLAGSPGPEPIYRIFEVVE